MFLQKCFVLQCLLAESSINPSTLSHVVTVSFKVSLSKERVFTSGVHELIIHSNKKLGNIRRILILFDRDWHKIAWLYTLTTLIPTKLCSKKRRDDYDKRAGTVSFESKKPKISGTHGKLKENCKKNWQNLEKDMNGWLKHWQGRLHRILMWKIR